MNPLGPLGEALASADPALIERTVENYQQSHPNAPFTWYARAELARLRANPAQALALSATGLASMIGGLPHAHPDRFEMLDVLQALLALPAARLQSAHPYLSQFGMLAEEAGITHRLEPSLAPIASQIVVPGTVAKLEPDHAIAAMALLGFSRGSALPWAESVFGRLLVPWMIAAAEGRSFEVALTLETVAYMHHVLRAESQAWFKATTGSWIPALARAARSHAPPLEERHRAWRPEAVRRVALFVHNATMLAHVAVLIETLQAVREIGARNYEFTVFAAAGRSAPMEEALGRCGVNVRYLERRPGMGIFERLLALERHLRRGNYAACFWITLVTMMAAAFPRRIAPIQGWWAMKYHACDVEEIDVHLAVESAVTRKVMEGIEWRTLGTASTRWLDRSKGAAARELRETFPADAVVAASIGREEKLDSPEFLAAVSRLLKRHPGLYFLWTGKSQRGSIVSHFEREGVADRARFVGWVDTRLYAQAIDLFLDSFPFPCGFTLKEAMAAGKPTVMFKSPESLETGVPGAISPVIESPPGGENAQVRERMRSIFTREHDFDLYFCAASAKEYFECADRLIADAALRRHAGEANRRFVEAFLSSPRDEAKKFLDHLDQIFAAAPSTRVT